MSERLRHKFRDLGPDDLRQIPAPCSEEQIEEYRQRKQAQQAQAQKPLPPKLEAAIRKDPKRVLQVVLKMLGTKRTEDDADEVKKENGMLPETSQDRALKKLLQDPSLHPKVRERLLDAQRDREWVRRTRVSEPKPIDSNLPADNQPQKPLSPKLKELIRGNPQLALQLVRQEIGSKERVERDTMEHTQDHQYKPPIFIDARTGEESESLAYLLANRKERASQPPQPQPQKPLSPELRELIRRAPEKAIEFAQKIIASRANPSTPTAAPPNPTEADGFAKFYPQSKVTARFRAPKEFWRTIDTCLQRNLTLSVGLDQAALQVDLARAGVPEELVPQIVSSISLSDDTWLRLHDYDTGS